MKTKMRNDFIFQEVPKKTKIKPITKVIVEGDVNEVVYRPSQDVNKLIKRGLIDGIKANSMAVPDAYDDKQGDCPLGYRLDVDTFDIATALMRRGNSQKAVSDDMSK